MPLVEEVEGFLERLFFRSYADEEGGGLHGREGWYYY